LLDYLKNYNNRYPEQFFFFDACRNVKTGSNLDAGGDPDPADVHRPPAYFYCLFTI